MGACSPLRIVVAILVLMFMLSIFFVGVIVLSALNAVSTSNLFKLMLIGWWIIGVPLMMYLTHVIGFSCETKAEDMDKKTDAVKTPSPTNSLPVVSAESGLPV